MVGKTFFEMPTEELQAALPLRQYDFGKPVGNVFFVGSTVSGAADESSRGRSPATPLATLDYAVGLCTPNNNDHIIVLPGHAETYTTTGTKVTLDIAGITIIGIGKGAERPTFTFSHTGATWVWSAAGVTLKNILFVTGVDLVTTFCTISGADPTLEDIETRDTTDVEVVDAFITTAAADRLTVRRHLHNGYTGGDANARVWKLVGCDRPVFEECRWITKVTTAIINFVTTACTGVDVNRCLFYVNGTTNFSKDVVDTVSGSTWALRNSFDLGAGQSMGGGSGASVGTADVSTITDALYGTNGVATFPAAAAPANNVSLAEVIRSIYNSVSHSGAASSVASQAGWGQIVTKSHNLTSDNADLFTVTGKVLVTSLIGEVTTVVGGAATYKIRVKTDNIDICAATTIDTDAAGTLYLVTGDFGDTFNGGETPTVKAAGHNGKAGPFSLGTVGGSLTLESDLDAADTGVILWTLTYIPLEANAAVAAA